MKQTKAAEGESQADANGKHLLGNSSSEGAYLTVDATSGTHHSILSTCR